MKLSRFLTTRSTVITLFTAISAALLLASSLPQRGSLGGNTPAWVEKLPGNLHFLTSLLGLDYIVGSGWFASLVALFWVSLVISTVSQYTATRLVTNRIPPAALPQECIRLDIPLESCAGLAAEAGYHQAGSADGVHRFVKNRIGYWGNFLLHLGLVTVVFFSLVYVLTQHRALFRLTGQEITRLNSANVQELRGVLPLQQMLPYSVVLKSLEPRFWANDKLEYLSSELYFTGQSGGEPQRVAVALSDKSFYGPYIVYQANAYGRAFDLEFVSAQGETRRERLYLPYPHRRDAAAYGEMAITGTGYLLKGKFYADTGHASMKLNNSPLTLRLYRGKDLLGEVTLTSGTTGKLGPLTVRLAQSEWWTDILLDGTRGTYGIFAGFALILAGVLSSYCLVPRETIFREADGGIYAQHVARRFPQFYREEFDGIVHESSNQGRFMKGSFALVTGIHWGAVVIYVVATIMVVVGQFFEKPQLVRRGFMVAVPGLILHGAGLAIWWKMVGHGPYIDRFEVLSSNAWILLLAFLLFTIPFPRLKAVGIVVLPATFTLVALGLFFNPEMKTLPPTFRSVWLVLHIIFYKIAFSAIIIAFAFSLFYLLRRRDRLKRLAKVLPDLAGIDIYAYRFAGFGFTFWAIGMLAGSIWAYQSWGTFWNWDPVQTWSLVTWGVFGIYLHLRRFFSWQGERASWLYVICFILTIVSLFLTPLFESSIHAEYFK